MDLNRNSGRSKLTARITLISHAATQATRRIAFSANEPADERELAKIADLGWRAPRVQRVWAGPEGRTLQTAAALNLTASIADELRDCDYGAWSGRTLDDIQSADPDGINAWLTDPTAAPHGAESIIQLVNRIGNWLEAASDAGHILAVTHPSVIRSAVIHALNAPPPAFWRIDVAPLSLTDLRFNGRAWTLRSLACPLRAAGNFPAAD